MFSRLIKNHCILFVYNGLVKLNVTPEVSNIEGGNLLSTVFESTSYFLISIRLTAWFSAYLMITM
jgi:hypothetical protein